MTVRRYETRGAPERQGTRSHLRGEVRAVTDEGTFEVLGSWTDRPMFNGISGTGHILLTVALTLVMLALRAAAAASVLAYALFTVDFSSTASPAAVVPFGDATARMNSAMSRPVFCR